MKQHCASEPIGRSRKLQAMCSHNIHGSERRPDSGALIEQLVLGSNKNVVQTGGQSVDQLTSADTQGNKKH
jgi:hypothetical protein